MIALLLKRSGFTQLPLLGARAVLCALGDKRRRLKRPLSVIPFIPPAEYRWDSGDERVSQTYIRPVVEEYLRTVPPGARVLDLGCGNGAMLGSFLEKGWKLVGVDVSTTGIEHARKRWPDAQFHVADATGDLSAIGQFDAVYSTEAIEHVLLPRRFVQNIFACLKPGGPVVLSTPYHGWLKNVTVALLNRYDTHHEPLVDWGHIKFWSPATLGQLLWEAGFEDVEYRGAGRTPYLWKSMILFARKPG